MKKVDFTATLFLASLLTLAGTLFESTGQTTAPLSKSFATQAETTHTLTIKDETGAEIGKYFDIRIDSFRVQRDTTANFQMIPNLGIQDSSLQQQYTTFLEMLLRNTGKEAEAVTDTAAIIGSFNTLNRNWGPAIDVFIGDEYNGTDDTLRALFNELNSGLGYNYFREVFSPTSKGWNFDLSKVDWRLDREVRKEILFNPDGTPRKCTFFIQGLFKYGNDLRRRVRHQIAEALLLNRCYTRELIDAEAYDPKYFRLTRFSPDFINLLKVGNALSNGRDFRYDQNEQNRTPVANAGLDQKDKRVGQLITLDATASLDPDGQIVSYRWQQMFGTKTGTEYMTSNRAALSDSTSPIVTFTPQWPGNYRFKLKVRDDQEKTNDDIVDIVVFWNNNPIEIRGINAFGYFDPNLEKEPFANYLVGNNIKWVEFAPIWWMETKFSNNIHPLGNYYPGAPGVTISDSDLVHLINTFHLKSLKVFLRPTIEFYNWAEWRGNLAPTDWNLWFESYKIFIKHYAQIAQQTSVELFSVGNELLNSNGFTEQWEAVIDTVKAVYKGLLIYSDSEPLATISRIQFWDKLDFIGIPFYYPGSGTFDNPNDGILDPSLSEMILNFNNALTQNVDPLYSRFQKPIIVTEGGCMNVDGANKEPWVWQLDFSKCAIDNREQQEFLEGAFSSLLAKTYIKGIFVFELELKLDYNFQGENTPFAYSLRYKPAESVLRIWYTGR